MARIRSVHPGLFTDENFVELSDTAQIFLVALWTECDDQGVFEWKPKRLKMRLRPASTEPVDGLLSELEDLEFVRRYEMNGRQYGAVRNFATYQRPRKPNYQHPIPPEVRTLVGLTDENTEPDPVKETPVPQKSELDTVKAAPVPHKSEIEKQMEDGGESKKKECPKPTGGRISYPLAFDEFWKAWQPTPNDPKKTAFGAWKKISAADHDRLMACLPAYFRFLRENQHPKTHASTFINQRRWEGFEEAEQPGTAGVVVQNGSPEWQAWLAHKRSLGEPTRFFERAETYTVPTQWPPGHEKAA